MKEQNIPSLSKLARMNNPFENDATTQIVKQKLLQENLEGRYLEWKTTLPIGEGVTIRTKYRTVKAIISFANTDGGFTVCGVRNDGKWIGVSKEDLSKIDSANITELINGCISPELEVNHFEMENKGRYFLILHVPPSQFVPHVTTKAIYEQAKDGKRNIILEKYAVYCRFGSKSDLARPNQFERIIKKRTEYLKMELLRRIKEVPVSRFVATKAPESISHTILRIGKKSDNKSLQTVRITRDRKESEGLLLHEKLSDGLFDEINNVLSVNKYLAKGSRKFVFSQEIYYQIYAERESIDAPNEEIELLALTGFGFYAPVLYWLLRLPIERFVEIIRQVSNNPKYPSVYSVMRLAILLGCDAEKWLQQRLRNKWGKEILEPSCYAAFDEMRRLAETKDKRLSALRMKADIYIELPNEDKSVPVSALLENTEMTSSILSKYCGWVFQGNKDKKGLCRALDLLAYGKDVEAQDYKIIKLLRK